MASMDLEYSQGPPPHWQDHQASRRRSSAVGAAGARPSGPPPNIPIPNLPYTSNSPSREKRSGSFVRPLNLQPHSMTDALSDPPPQSYLPVATSSSDRDHNPSNRRSSLAPQAQTPNRSEHRPSSRRALTRALELAREAVQLDSTNDNPVAAVNAYAQSVALLSEVMERVRNGEDSTESHRRRQRRSISAQEKEVKRLQNIHDTYADRMNILSIIYSIPAIPYPISSLYANTTISTDSAASNSPTNSASPSSDSSPHLPPEAYPSYILDEEPVYSNPNTQNVQDFDVSRDIYTLDESVLTGSAISGLPATQHPYSLQYDSSPPQANPLPAARVSMSMRRVRASSQLPPKLPLPTSSPPPAPLKRPDSQLRLTDSKGHKKTSSGLVALEEETDEAHLRQESSEDPQSGVDIFHNTNRDSPPLPPLPSSPAADTFGTSRSLPASKPPPSPRLASSTTVRPRGSSQLTTRTELANVPYANQEPIVYQRRKTSAPPSTRSASPTESTTSAGSVPTSIPAVPSLPSSGLASGRSRSSSQPSRRASIAGGRTSPDQRPPLPTGTNGTPRKSSVPSRLNPNLSIPQLEPLSINVGLMNGQIPGFPGNLPTTPTSPLPPAPPNDPLLKPYHMMRLLRTTMVNPTGGYVTRRLHVPFEVWSQGGAKLTNLDDKLRAVESLVVALDTLQISSCHYFGAGNVSSGLALGIGSIGRKEANAWLLKLDDFSNVCDMVVADHGKKLGVGEGFVARKSTWGVKFTRRLDKLTNGKNLDSPTAYVDELKRLFMHAQLLDEHTRAVFSQPMAPAYAAFPMDIRGSTEQKLKHISEFFARVVLTFVIRDLSQLLDKYVKKCEKWLAE
ncbi:hypothetical protein BYT27DRAFT_7165470 [Phlegmacium glaucopus]|nr:hypothetical protein BYT27DRAFT_7165470 [Phlegmacium glaucopus]